MTKAFQVALLGAAASAAHLGLKEKQEFLGFAAQFSKDYKTKEELAERLSIFQSNHAKVQELNRINKGVSFEINFRGDWKPEEWAMTPGLGKDFAGVEAHNGGSYNAEEDPVLRGVEKKSVNWATKDNDHKRKRMGPVKDQGDSCGSCWAFAATSCQEAAQSILYREKPLHLSEQEGIDCDEKSSGCSGGRVTWYWDFSRRSGSKLAHNYKPYTASKGDCVKKTLSEVASRVKNYSQVSENNMKFAIQNAPMTIRVDVSGNCWKLYKQGVFSSETQGCKRGTDEDESAHTVVLVGYHKAGDQGIETKKFKRVCRKVKRREMKARQCDGKYERYQNKRNKKKGLRQRRCCSYIPKNVQVETDWEKEYWIVQNSWGTHWGRLGGFIHLAVEDDLGVSGMNREVFQVEVEKGECDYNFSKWQYPDNDTPFRLDRCNSCGYWTRKEKQGQSQGWYEEWIDTDCS